MVSKKQHCNKTQTLFIFNEDQNMLLFLNDYLTHHAHDYIAATLKKSPNVDLILIQNMTDSEFNTMMNLASFLINH